jgi:TRAP-type mannitol/chloroaromatic compound transport system permease large subunit
MRGEWVAFKLLTTPATKIRGSINAFIVITIITIYILYYHVLYGCIIIVIILMLEPVDRHEGIASAAVVGIPHTKMGEQVRWFRG